METRRIRRETMTQIRISAKVLGELALPDFCPRCFWIKLKCKKLPYQIFPGIFTSIDSYTKKVVHLYFEKHDGLPAWFGGFGSLGQPVEVPPLNQFRIIDKDTNIMLTGIPDEIFRKPDGSYFIVDYKTARFTGNQDRLLPMYTVQLNAYAYIAERTSFNPINGLGLIYYEPATDIRTKVIDLLTYDDRFSMYFVAKLLSIEYYPDSIKNHLRKTREIYDLPRPPEGVRKCENCKLLSNLILLL